MQYEKIYVKVTGSKQMGTLTTYCLDNTEEIDENRIRPVILLCPGGGYAMTSDREAEAVAMQFLAAGCQVAILRYSVNPEHYPTALRQVAWSVMHLRKNSDKYHIKKDKIIIMGFSAGGHLAASYGVFWRKEAFLSEELGVVPEVLRPNGLILCYPVITSGKYAHEESFQNLLGEQYGELLEKMSLEKQVTKDTPPVFLWHTQLDALVPVENTILFFQALHEKKIPVEMHIYHNGDHGLSLANEETQSRGGGCIVPECQNWISMAIQWVKRQK